MAMPLAYSFDYRGINDATSPYRERIATFSTAIPSDEVARHGHLWAAAPGMLAALESADCPCWVHNAGVTNDIEVLRAIALWYAGWNNNVRLPALAKAEGR